MMRGVVLPHAEAEIELQHREASWLDFELAHDHCKRQAKKTQNSRQVVSLEILAMDCGAG